MKLTPTFEAAAELAGVADAIVRWYERYHQLPAEQIMWPTNHMQALSDAVVKLRHARQQEGV